MEANQDMTVNTEPLADNIKNEPQRDLFSNPQPESEIVLFEAPEELPEESNFFIIFYFLLTIGSEIVGKIVFGALLLYTVLNKDMTFEPIVLCLAGFHIWKILFNLFFLIMYGSRLAEFRKTYIFDMMLSTGYLSVFIVLYLYLKGSIDATSLPWFVAPHIILTFIRLLVGEWVRTPFLPFSSLVFYESIQILIIAFKLADPANSNNWTWTLLFFYFVCIFYIALSYISIISILIFSSVYFFNRDVFRRLDRFATLSILSILFYVIWNGFAYFYLLTGIRLLLDQDLIGPNKSVQGGNDRLQAVAIIMIVCGLLSLVILSLFYYHLKYAILKVFGQGQIKKVSLTQFAKGLNLGITQQSENYFTRTTASQLNKETNGVSPQDTQCVICMDKKNEIYIDPCGHSGMCQDCITKALQSKDNCPICKTDIGKIYLIYYDEEKRTYMAKGQINFKKRSMLL